MTSGVNEAATLTGRTVGVPDGTILITRQSPAVTATEPVAVAEVLVSEIVAVIRSEAVVLFLIETA